MPEEEIDSEEQERLEELTKKSIEIAEKMWEDVSDISATNDAKAEAVGRLAAVLLKHML